MAQTSQTNPTPQALSEALMAEAMNVAAPWADASGKLGALGLVAAALLASRAEVERLQTSYSHAFAVLFNSQCDGIKRMDVMGLHFKFIKEDGTMQIRPMALPEHLQSATPAQDKENGNAVAE